MSGVDDIEAVPAPATRKRWKQVLAVIVVIASLVWTVVLVRAAWGDFSQNLQHLALIPLAIGLALALTGTILGFTAFARLFHALGGQAFRTAELAHLHFVAQLMRHLPGRFFGLAYQVAVTRGSVPMTKWIAVNGVYTLLSLCIGIAASLAVIVSERSLPGAVVLFAACVAICLLLWTPTFLRAVSRFAARRRLPLMPTISRLTESLAQLDRTARFSVIGQLALSWLLYFIAWGFYARAYPGLGIHDGIVMCAFYSIAWLVGYVSLVTPSGLGVRELAFAALALSFAPGATAYGIVIGRLSLLVIDIVLGLVFLRNHGKYRHRD